MSGIDESKAPLLEHLVELRRRLLICVVALVIGFAVCFYFANPIFRFLIQPFIQAGGKSLVFTKLYGQFLVNVKIGLFGSFLICFPIIAMQLWAFVAPGLYAKEKRALLPFLAVTPILFFMGASLAYFVVMPAAFHFFLGFGGNFGSVNVQALPDTDLYLSTVMRFVLAFGISFLLPVLLMLLNRAGIITRAQLVGARRFAWVGAFIIAAVVTPPDAMSMLALALPLVLLFEVALIAIWFTERRKAKEAALESEEDSKEDIAVAE